MPDIELAIVNINILLPPAADLHRCQISMLSTTCICKANHTASSKNNVYGCLRGRQTGT